MDALILGATIGLAAGISPGPLLFLTITSALRSGARAGVIVACAPLLSDIVVVTALGCSHGLLVRGHDATRPGPVRGSGSSQWT